MHDKFEEPLAGRVGALIGAGPHVPDPWEDRHMQCAIAIFAVRSGPDAFPDCTNSEDAYIAFELADIFIKEAKQREQDVIEEFCIECQAPLPAKGSCAEAWSVCPNCGCVLVDK